MTTNNTTITHYNGTLWRTVPGPDGTRTIRPFRLAGGALVARGAIRCYRNPARHPALP